MCMRSVRSVLNQYSYLNLGSIMIRTLVRNILRVVASLTLTLSITQACYSYSVLTHEAIVDMAWSDSIKPLLLKRFPATTNQQLLEAHAYAYGGAIIQDMGYYPFGSALFTNLTHYVRSGDFVMIWKRSPM
jgi:hypothetical protein